MIFGRVKPLDAILATAEKKSLHRTLGWFQLMLFGIGCVIGTGIFVLTAAGAQKAGPGLMLAFAIAGAVCIIAALCYAEIASMIPVADSAYTYSYASVGELLAWTVGWALIMEYAIAAAAVSVGWSGYFSGTFLNEILGVQLPAWLAAGPLVLGGAPGGLINLPALIIALLVTGLLIVGTSESAKVNAVLVLVKVTALTAFIALTFTSPDFDASHFNPFLPAGVFGGFGSGLGAVGAAATIFFAYVGFDAVSTAAEETKNPQKNVPIGLVGSLLFCTVFYILVAAGAIGTIGGQPIMGPNGVPFPTGSEELARQCATYGYRPASTGLLERGTGACAAPDRLVGHRQPAGHCRVPCAAIGHPGADLRPDAHLLRDGARRVASRKPQPGAPEVQDAAYRDHAHRRRGCLGCSVLPGRQARRYLQRWHTLRLHDGGGRAAGAAPSRSFAQTGVPRPGGVVDCAADDCGLRVPVPQPAIRGDAVPARLGPARDRDLLRLQPFA
jgi:hypothetical protein